MGLFRASSSTLLRDDYGHIDRLTRKRSGRGASEDGKKLVKTGEPRPPRFCVSTGTLIARQERKEEEEQVKTERS